MSHKIQKYSFTTPYNGVQIKNPTNNENAVYYVLQVEDGNIYLQTHIPFINGIEAITEDNFLEVSSNHAKILEDMFMESKKFLEKNK